MDNVHNVNPALVFDVVGSRVPLEPAKALATIAGLFNTVDDVTQQPHTNGQTVWAVNNALTHLQDDLVKARFYIAFYREKLAQANTFSQSYKDSINREISRRQVLCTGIEALFATLVTHRIVTRPVQ